METQETLEAMITAVDEKCDLIIRFVSENKNAIEALSQKVEALQSEVDRQFDFIENNRDHIGRLIGLIEGIISREARRE